MQGVQLVKGVVKEVREKEIELQASHDGISPPVQEGCFSQVF